MSHILDLHPLMQCLYVLSDEHSEKATEHS